MDPALWGAITAVGWGTGDFIARYTGRAMGVLVALCGMLLVSGIGLTLLILDDLSTLAWHPEGGPLAIAGGIGITFATLLLYWGLARGPVSVVAPISACYPAYAMLIAVARGAQPGIAHWLAGGAVLAGAIVVARYSAENCGPDGYSHDHIRKSALIGVGAGAGFALAVLLAQEAATFYGELPTLWISRWVGLFCLILVLAVQRRRPRLPVRWLPFLALQGLLDSAAYAALFVPAGQQGAEIAVVVSSGFSAVTVLLARVILREAMTIPQWAGIAAILGGVAALSHYS